MRTALSRLLDGPHLKLWRPADAAAEWWSRRRPRTRMILGAAMVVLAAGFVSARSHAADARWGGEPVRVYVATRDLAIGDAVGDLRRVRFPPAIVPPRAVTKLPADAVLTFALPEGTVLTQRHLDPAGPAAGLPADLQAVPVPAEPGWGLVVGGRVDVWVLAGGERAAARVARSRPVLDLRDDAAGLTALLGLSEHEVGRVSEGLAVGRVLLTHTAAVSAATAVQPGARPASSQPKGPSACPRGCKPSSSASYRG